MNKLLIVQYTHLVILNHISHLWVLFIQTPHTLSRVVLTHLLAKQDDFRDFISLHIIKIQN